MRESHECREEREGWGTEMGVSGHAGECPVAIGGGLLTNPIVFSFARDKEREREF